MEYLQVSNLILAFLLGSLRITGAFMICPAMTDSMIPGLAKRVMIFGFSVLVFPVVFQAMPPQRCSLLMLSFAGLRETFIGVLIGFFASIPFWVAENIGNFIDNQRGATMGEIYSPLSGTQVSTMGIFFTQMVSTIFFVTGAFLLMLTAIYKSYGVWPVFGNFVSLANNAPVQMLNHLDVMLQDTVVISAPVIIIMFLATLGLGFVNRTAPQLNVFFLSMPIKSALGVAMLVIYLPYILDMLMYSSDAEVLNPVMKLFK